MGEEKIKLTRSSKVGSGWGLGGGVLGRPQERQRGMVGGRGVGVDLKSRRRKGGGGRGRGRKFTFVKGVPRKRPRSKEGCGAYIKPCCVHNDRKENGGFRRG